jgi:hypothetical protein
MTVVPSASPKCWRVYQDVRQVAQALAPVTLEHRRLVKSWIHKTTNNELIHSSVVTPRALRQGCESSIHCAYQAATSADS